MLTIKTGRNSYKQRIYRNELLLLYKQKCAISNQSIIHTLEACHIVPYELCNKICGIGNGATIQYCKYNGILLDKKFHRSEIEIYKFTFDFPNYEWVDDKWISIPILITQHNNQLLHIKKYENKRIQIPYQSLYFIKFHYLEFMKREHKIVEQINYDYLPIIKNFKDNYAIDKDEDIIMLSLL